MSDLENSREEFINEITSIVEALRGFGGNIDSLTRLSAGNLTEEQRQSIITRRFEQEKKEWNEKTSKILSENATALVNFGRSLTAAPGSFSPLNAAVNLTQKAFTGLVKDIPFVGGVLKGLGEAAGETAKFMIDTFQSAYSTFERISDIGVVTTFDDMRKSSSALGLTFADTEKVFNKTSKDLALFGGSATTGRKLVESLGYSSDLTRRQMQRLGISAEEVTEFQISYIAQQQRYTRGQLKDVNSLREGSEKYIKELDVLSKLTGVSRKQLQTEQEARLRDTRYRAGIASLGKKEREEIDKFFGIIKQSAPQMEEGFKDIIAANGAITTEAARNLVIQLAQGGMDVRDVSLMLRQGALGGYKAFQMVASASGLAADATRKLASVVGDQTSVTKLQVELEELAAKKSSMTEAEYTKQQKAIKAAITATEGQNAALADTKISMYNAGRNIELLATSSEFATKTMKFFAQGIEWLTEKMYEISGGDLPEHVKARQEERKAISQELKAIDAYNKAAEKTADKIITSVDSITGERTEVVLTVEEQLSGFKLERDQTTKKREEATKKRKDADRTAGLGTEPEKQVSEKVSKEQQLVDRLKKELLQKQAMQGVVMDDKTTLLQEIENLKTRVTDAKEKENQAEVERLQKEILQKEDKIKGIETKIDKANEEAQKVQESLANAERKRDRAILEERAGVARPASSRNEPSEAETALKKKTAELKLLEGPEANLLKDVKDAKKLMDAAREKVEAAKKEASTGVRRGESTIEASVLRQSDARVAGNKLVEATQAYESAKGKQEGSTRQRETLKREITDLAAKVKQETDDRAKKEQEAGSDTGDIDIEKFVTFSNSDSGSLAAFNEAKRLRPDIHENFVKMAEEYSQMTDGQKLTMVSSFRTYERQKKLHEDYKQGISNLPAAPAGTSKHEAGRAFDLTRDQVSKLDSLGLLSKYGFKTIADDPPHIYMENGGVIQARPGGTNVVAAEAGMNEAFVPLPNGKSIPVDIKNSFFRELTFNISEMSDNMGSLLKEANSSIVQSNDRIVERLEKLNIVFTSTVSKLTDVINVLESSRNIQKNLLDNSMT